MLRLTQSDEASLVIEEGSLWSCRIRLTEVLFRVSCYAFISHNCLLNHVQNIYTSLIFLKQTIVQFFKVNINL